MVDRLHRYCFNDLAEDIKWGFHVKREKWGNGDHYIWYNPLTRLFMLHWHNEDKPWNSDPDDFEAYDWYIV